MMTTALTQGIDQLNTRTNKICRAIVGYQFQTDISKCFSAITMRRLPFVNMKGELLGFFRGYTNAADFRKLGCKFWDKNANETKTWLTNELRKGEDDLGPIYGKQWTDWVNREIAIGDAERDIYLKRGYEVTMYAKQKDNDTEYQYLMERHINQLEKVLHTLITNPSDRRCIVSGWNVGELDMMALPPCHMDYKFVVIEGILHCVMGIRSWDLYLGAPSNIAATALFASIMARLAGYKPGTITIQATNAHLYEDSFEATELLLKREVRDLPTLYLSDNIKQITNLEDIKGAFERIEPSDIDLIGYMPNTDLLIGKDGKEIVVEMAA